MTRRSRFIAATFIVPSLAGVAAIAGPGPAFAVTKTKSTAAPKVSIKGFAFSPAKLTAKVGQTITVTNADGATHTLTADNGSFDTGNLNGGKSGRIKATKKGTFAFHCNLHGSMKGTLTVS